MPISTYAAKKLMDLLFGGAAFTPPASIYISLHTADPGYTGLDELPSTGGYERIEQANDKDFWTNASPSRIVTNKIEFIFGPASADWAQVTHFGIWDADTAGNFLGGGALNAAKTVTEDEQLRFKAGYLSGGMS